MKVKFGNSVKDVPIKEVTPENYLVPKGEETAYHVMQCIPFFDQRTGKDLSNYRIQKYGVKEYHDISRNLKQLGYKITVLHDPSEYLKEQADAREAQESLTAAKKRELEAKRREAEKAALKAEILAELKEQGLIKAEDESEAETEKKTAKGTTTKKK